MVTLLYVRYNNKFNESYRLPEDYLHPREFGMLWYSHDAPMRLSDPLTIFEPSSQIFNKLKDIHDGPNTI